MSIIHHFPVQRASVSLHFTPWKNNFRIISFIPHSQKGEIMSCGNPLQYSCLENPRDGRAWWAAVYGVAQSQTRLSDWTELNPCGWREVFLWRGEMFTLWVTPGDSRAGDGTESRSEWKKIKPSRENAFFAWTSSSQGPKCWVGGEGPQVFLQRKR